MICICSQCGWTENAEYQPDKCPSCDGEMTNAEPQISEQDKPKNGEACMGQMKDAKFMTAKEKETVLKAWERFMQALAAGKTDEGLFRTFTEALYHHLIQHCSFIAHYDRAGFFQHYFTEPEMTLKFLSQFDVQGPCLSVEYGMDYWIRNGNDVCQEYYDINQEMVRIATEHISGIQGRLHKNQESLDVSRAKALLGKHGLSLNIVHP